MFYFTGVNLMFFFNSVDEHRRGGGEGNHPYITLTVMHYLWI